MHSGGCRGRFQRTEFGGTYIGSVPILALPLSLPILSPQIFYPSTPPNKGSRCSEILGEAFLGMIRALPLPFRGIAVYFWGSKNYAVCPNNNHGVSLGEGLASIWMASVAKGGLLRGLGRGALAGGIHDFLTGRNATASLGIRDRVGGECGVSKMPARSPFGGLMREIRGTVVILLSGHTTDGLIFPFEKKWCKIWQNLDWV